MRDELVVLAWCVDDESDVDNEDEEEDSEESKESDDDDDDNRNDDSTVHTTGRRDADDAAASKTPASSAPSHSLHKVCSLYFANTHCKKWSRDTVHEWWWFNNPPCMRCCHTLRPQRFE